MGDGVAARFMNEAFNARMVAWHVRLGTQFATMMRASVAARFMDDSGFGFGFGAGAPPGPGSQVRARSNAAGPQTWVGFPFPGLPGAGSLELHSFISFPTKQRTKQVGSAFLVCHSDILYRPVVFLCFCVFVFCSPTSILL